MALDLFTIGYQGLDVETFFWLLEKERIQVVVDVRQSPRSRNPHFTGSAVQEAAEDAGLKYVHMGELGVPVRIRQTRKHEKDFPSYARVYRKYLLKQKPALRRLYELCSKSRCCLMCLEREPRRCHRSILAEALSRMNGKAFTVTDL
jgi:uncharacterized protein (DUF488 family)